MHKIVSNTTPIIALLKIGQLTLLRDIYKKIIVPRAVFTELNKGKNRDYYKDISKIDWFKIHDIQNKIALNYFFELDAGEAEVIVLGTEIRADLVIIDETIGRRFAKHAGLKVTGTIGILLKAKEVGLIKKISPLLDELQTKGMWIGRKLKEKIITIANEQN